MECAEIQERLSEYIDGTLDEEAETAVKTHISVCENCQSELASLKAVVEELGALEPVKAPDDFLEKIHERITPRFSFDGIFRWLFIPFRIKIPLELAAAATLTLLVILVLNIQYPGKQIRQIPAASKSMQIAEKPTDEQVQSLFKKEAKTPAPRLGELPVKPLKTKPIELALIFKPAAAGGVYEPNMAMKAAQMQKSDKIPVESKRMKSDSYETNVLAKRKTPATDLTSRLKNIIQHYQGRVTNKEFDTQTAQLKSINAEIPAKNYPSFCKELSRLAEFQTPPPPLADNHPATLRISIQFIHPER